MTKLQEAEFEILKSVVKICNELNLKYYLVCGTALGAAKYHGFIPWDDDVDIAMKRQDFELFCNRAQELLPEGLFLQTSETDPFFSQIYAKVRNTNTAFVETSAHELDINHGIYIDVFPLDGYPKNKRQQNKLELKKKILHLQMSCVYTIPDDIKFSSRLFLKIERLLRCHLRTAKTVRRLSNLLAQTGPDDSAVWCNHGNWQGKLEYAPREQYGDGAFAEFEGLRVRIPEEFDAYLTQKYGDWRADLPPEQKVGHHFADVIDIDRPYTDYIVKLGKGKIRLKSSDELARDGIPVPDGYRY